MSIKTSHSFKNDSLSAVLQDLSTRFIINCPSEDLNSSERLFFQLEEAQWFYEDFIRVQNPSLPSMKLKFFVEKLFQACPILNIFSKNMINDLTKFQNYKSGIPVRGAIILNKKMTKCLMVKGWKQGAAWGFPRGKINKDEEDHDCAIREVYEEIGYDISPYLVKEDYIEIVIKQKNIRLYIVRGIPGNTQFCPQTRKEISKIEWHDVELLPAYSKQFSSLGDNNNNYIMVAPFMAELANYINKAKGIFSDGTEKLTKTETKALKSMLGIGNEKEDQQYNNEEQQAADLLSMLKKGPATTSTNATNQEESNDRRVLLNLLNKKNSNQPGEEIINQSNMDSAKEILSLLKKDDNNNYNTNVNNNSLPLPPVFPPPLPPPEAFMMMGGPNPGGPPLPPIPPPAFFMNGHNNNNHNNSFPPPPPHPMSLPPMQPPPPPPPPLEASTNSNIPDYTPPPPPPPPNPMLLSLLNSRRSGTEHNNNSSSQQQPEEKNAMDPRYDSMAHKNKKSQQDIKLSELFNNDRNQQEKSSPQKASTSTSNALLSLLEDNKSAKPSNNQQQQQKEPESEQSSSASLMHLLNNPTASSSTPLSKDGEAPPEEDSSSSSELLMNMIKPSKPKKSDSLMDLLNPGSTKREPEPQPTKPSNESDVLMDLLKGGSESTPQTENNVVEYHDSDQNDDESAYVRFLTKFIQSK